MFAVGFAAGGLAAAWKFADVDVAVVPVLAAREVRGDRDAIVQMPVVGAFVSDWSSP